MTTASIKSSENTATQLSNLLTSLKEDCNELKDSKVSETVRNTISLVSSSFDAFFQIGGRGIIKTQIISYKDSNDWLSTAQKEIHTFEIAVNQSSYKDTLTPMVSRMNQLSQTISAHMKVQSQAIAVCEKYKDQKSPNLETLGEELDKILNTSSTANSKNLQTSKANTSSFSFTATEKFEKDCEYDLSELSNPSLSPSSQVIVAPIATDAVAIVNTTKSPTSTAS